jgi:hypothetical protein
MFIASVQTFSGKKLLSTPLMTFIAMDYLKNAQNVVLKMGRMNNIRFEAEQKKQYQKLKVRYAET